MGQLSSTSSRSAAADERLRLVHLLADDLDAGFLECVRTYQRPVYSLALRLSGQSFDAEDLAAETFLRAYRALRTYDRARLHDLQLRPWLMTIALNVWRNLLRTDARRAEELPLELVVDTPSETDEAQRVVERSDQRRQLSQLVSVLPEPQRVAVVMRYICDLPVAEVAQVLGCSEGTAKSHISRGLQRVRAAVAQPLAAGHLVSSQVTPQRMHHVLKGGNAHVRDQS